MRLDPMIERSYHLTSGPDRLVNITRSIVVGLVLYNGFFFTSILLLPDMVSQNLILRFVVVTPMSLGLIFVLHRVGPQTREWLILGGMLNAYGAMALMVWLSAAPLAGYAIAELTLILVFGAFTLALRFVQTILFLTICTLTTFVVINGVTGITDDLRYALWMQAFTGFVFCVYGNFQIEQRRCATYVRTYRAGQRAIFAEEETREMTHLSLTDPLTGLPNRRALELRCDVWTKLPDPMTIVMIDIDHFKLYNDTLGHPAGDDCLRRVARALHAVTGNPNANLLARIGGEEFAVLLRGSDATRAQQIAERLRQAVLDLNLSHPGQTAPPGCITISVGIASPKQGHATNLTDLLERADLSLYQAKRRGRNQVCCATLAAVG